MKYTVKLVSKQQIITRTFKDSFGRKKQIPCLTKSPFHFWAVRSHTIKDQVETLAQFPTRAEALNYVKSLETEQN